MSKLTIKLFTKKHIALKLYNYFTCEKNRNRLYRSISDPFKRTKHLLDLSDRTLNRWIMRENSEEVIFIHISLLSVSELVSDLVRLFQDNLKTV